MGTSGNSVSGTASDESSTLLLLISLIHLAFQMAAVEPFGKKWRKQSFRMCHLKKSGHQNYSSLARGAILKISL